MTEYETTLLKICSRKGYYPRSLGTVAGDGESHSIWLIETSSLSSIDVDPSALIVSGFHGEEIAGPWAILKWLEMSNPERFKGVDVSFLPCVNLYGFINGKRTGKSGIAPNAGFYRTDEEPGPEGQILKKHINDLRKLADGGYLSLHEDIESSEYYLYTFEPGEKPGRFTAEMKKTLASHFIKPFTGVAWVDTRGPGEGPLCEDGIIYKFCDGSFDDYMYQLGVPRVAVTETPGKYSITARIDASIDLIDKFISLVAEGA